jgi:hypothetical protein
MARASRRCAARPVGVPSDVVGFFTSRPLIARSDDAEPTAVPEWLGPPRGVLPGYAPERAVVFRTAEATLVVGRFDVYRTGVEFTIELQLRSEDEDLIEVPWELHRRRPRSGGLPDEFLRFGVEFADGSSWSNLDSFPASTEPPAGPFVMSQGGGGGNGRWSMNQWLWPLPPAGPLTIIAEWPKYGIAESRATVDAGKLREAAERAENLWEV